MQISNDFISTKKLYGSYFDRRWWRENDIFIKANTFGSDNPEILAPGTPFDIIRTGNGLNNFGILRTFYTLGYEHKYSIKSDLFGYESQFEYSGRLYWERFIDDKKIGDRPSARDGIYYEPLEICNVDLDNTSSPLIL